MGAPLTGDEAYERGSNDIARAIASRIRAELVCCDIYDQDAGTSRAGQTHAICFWGEAGARLAEDVAATGPREATDAGEFSQAIDALEARGIAKAVAMVRSGDFLEWLEENCQAEYYVLTFSAEIQKAVTRFLEQSLKEQRS